MKHLLYILILIFIASCKTGADSEKVQKPDTKKLDSDSETKEQLDTVVPSDSYKIDYIPVDTNINRTLIKKYFSAELKSNLSQWIGFYEKISSDFKIDDFKNSGNSFLKPYQVALGDSDFNKRFFDLYNPYLKYSPDSIKAIDLYSYTYVLDYDSAGNVIGYGDVDCQLAIIDLEKQKRIVLQTIGMAGEFQDCFWLNNDSIIVTSIETSDGESYEPYYAMIDLKTYLINYFELETKLNLSEVNYVNLIFKNIEFE